MRTVTRMTFVSRQLRRSIRCGHSPWSTPARLARQVMRLAVDEAEAVLWRDMTLEEAETLCREFLIWMVRQDAFDQVFSAPEASLRDFLHDTRILEQWSLAPMGA